MSNSGDGRQIVDLETQIAGLTVQLLGPFAFTRAEGDLTRSRTGLIIPAGALLLRAPVTIVEDLEGDFTGAFLELTAQDGPPVSGTAIVGDFDLEAGYPDTTLTFARVEPDASNGFPQHAIFAVQDMELCVRGSGAWFGGEIHVFALIASPVTS